jgi:bidirectional [NiFe] hydrogenase diaphorase subunit
MPEPAVKTRSADAPHPSGDDRFKLIDATMRRHRHQPDSLIEVLHTAQDVFGSLSPDLLHYIAHGLKLPTSRVYGVATFYHFFTFEPKGDHSCVVCLGTTCYVKGGEAIREAVDKFVKGETRCGRVSVETARCIGACGLAPVALVDGQVRGNLTTEIVVDLLKAWVPDGP